MLYGRLTGEAVRISRQKSKGLRFVFFVFSKMKSDASQWLPGRVEHGEAVVQLELLNENLPVYFMQKFLPELGHHIDSEVLQATH